MAGESGESAADEEGRADGPSNDDELPFPYLPVGFACLGMLAHSVAFTAPLPFVAFMIVDFHMANNLDEAGYTAGWITGMFMVGRSIAGIPWGMAADRYGRRICLALSMLNVFIFGILFGFSFNFYAAAFFRFLLGLGNGFMGISKTYMSEVTKCRDHEMRALSYVNGFWGIGMIIGPAIGGMLARPAFQYPKYFSASSIWGQFPYLLPALACSIFALVAALGLFFCAPETLLSRSTSASASYTQVTQKDTEDDIEMVVVQNPLSDGDEISAQMSPPSETDCQVEEVSQTRSSSANSAKPALPATFRDILKNKPIQHTFFVYMTYCFICMFYDETFPLFAVSSLGTGGLAWTSAEVGESLAAVGLMLVIFQLFIYEHVMRRFFTSGAKQTLISTMTIVSCTMVTLPLFSDWILRSLWYLKAPTTIGKVLLYLVVVVSISVYKMPSMANFTNISMIVNASVDPSMRGTLNGLMMTAGSIGNGFGPILGSALYAFAIDMVYPRTRQEDNLDSTTSKSSLEFNSGRLVLPIDGRIVFIFSAIMCFSLSFYVRKYIHLDW